MPKIDIGNIEKDSDMRRPFLEWYSDDKLSNEAHIVLWAIQRLVDMDLPLTVSTISDATDYDYFVIKRSIDEIEQRYNWKLEARQANLSYFLDMR